MIRVATVEQANERRIFRSMQPYMEGEEKCNLEWIRGVIGTDVPLARQFLLTRSAQYRDTTRYSELEEVLSCGNQRLTNTTRTRIGTGNKPAGADA